MPPPPNPPPTRATERPFSPDEWVDRHGPYLYRYALSRVRRQEVAEELVQDALLAAWRGRQSFTGRASERTWLAAILKRKIIDWLRASVKRRRHDAAGHDVWAAAQFAPRGTWRTAPGHIGDGVPTDGPTREEFWREFQACLDALPLRLRDVFVLKYLDESPSEDVCARAGVSAGNLWVMLHRARLRLAACLTEHWFDAEGKP
jgi:RNA polymerase sigma-70 factor (ECF subfamily)